MNDTKPDTTRGSEIAELEGELQNLADAVTCKHPQLRDAALAMIAALGYKDETLIDSSRVSLQTALADVANDWIAGELAASSAMQAGLKDGWQRHIDKKAHELCVFEKIKDSIESIIDERVAGMLEARKLVHSLKHLGQPVEKAPVLEEGIRQLRKFREDFLRRWPSREQPLPIDREAISKAREAARAGEKGLSKDQMIWRGKRSEESI